jgi:very-short-patch-repair endonuclease
MAKSPIEGMLRDAIRDGAARSRILLFDYTSAKRVVLADDLDFSSSLLRQVSAVDAVAAEDAEVAVIDDPVSEWSLYSNCKIASYRADLLLMTNQWALVVECDGHDYHNITKQQAAYDRSRDRDLLALGINTIRFTGSEIHHSADRCAGDVYRVGHALDQRSGREVTEWRRGYQAGYEHGRNPKPITREDI